jgi:hypothetical protein
MAAIHGGTKQALAASEADRIRDLNDQARELLEKGRGPEAALVFGRVLLHDPACEEARQGLERARAAVSEQHRRLEARFDAAERALELGDRGGARRSLEAILEAGGDRDRALELLDRLDDRTGIVTLRGALGDAASAGFAAEPAKNRTLSRRAFALAWTLVVATLASGLAVSWESLLARLVATPSPSARLALAATRLPQPLSGERSVSEARRLLDAGDAAAARSVLDQVSPSDAAYPFARQMRAQAEAALRQKGSAR